MQIIRTHKYYLVALAVWGLSIITKYQFNGLVFGFDYGNYQPDGKFYTYMALDYLKQNPNQSAQQVVDWYSVHGFKMNIFTIQDLMPNTSYAYPVISHRVLYPLLSVPFVALFGIPGMLVVPALSLLALFLCIQKLASNFYKPQIGLAIILILSSSSTVMRWMMVNCTDGLLVGLFSFLPILLLHNFRSNQIKVLIFLILIALTSATRFVLPFWLCIVLVLVLRNRRFLENFFLALFSTICAIPALKAQLATALLPADTDSPILSKIIKLPISFLKVVAIDVLEFGVLDRVFLLFIGLAVIMAIRLYQRLSSQVFAAVVLAGYIIGAINGTLGVNFRYQIPTLVFASWVVLDALEIRNLGLRLVPAIKGHIIINKAE